MEVSMDFFKFLNEAVTPFHTVDCLKRYFEESGNGRFRIWERGGMLIVALQPPNGKAHAGSRFRIVMAHTDFPALKITPNPDLRTAGIQTLHPEIYGSPIYTSWFDRDLGYAGIVLYELNGEIENTLIRSKELVRIPQLAIHLNRNVNQDGQKVNPQTDLNALWSSREGARFVDALLAQLPKGALLLDFDIQLFDAQPAQYGGLDKEWVFSSRLDNLSSCHAAAIGLMNARDSSDFKVACFFNNEEVGSLTREGAAGNFLKSVLDQMLAENGLYQIGNPKIPLDKFFSESHAISLDMAHAEHPNFPEKSEPNHAPILGKGVALKINSQKRYASDVFSSAWFKTLCSGAGVPFQTFVMRNDIPCGSTVGPMVSAALGIPTVDVGEPMLSMHSIREMTAAQDHKDLEKLISFYFR